jgi:hypothetical protein
MGVSIVGLSKEGIETDAKKQSRELQGRYELRQGRLVGCCKIGDIEDETDLRT